MKKFVSGIIVGALLFAGASAFADSTVLTGKKVSGMYVIEKRSGGKIADAAIIDGTAYAPVRAVAEATGAKLTVEGKKIIVGETAAEIATSNKDGVDDLKAGRDKISADITRLDNGIKDIEKNVLPGLRESAEILSTNGKIGERAKETLAQYETQLLKDKTELITLQAQLIEIDAKIAALEK